MDVYLASGNAHKFQEFQEMLFKSPVRLNFFSASMFEDLPEVEENGTSFLANATIKAQALLPYVPDGAWVLADDSGLEVDALNGAPGIHSARYAGPHGNASANNLKLLHELEGLRLEERTARFVCVLVFMKTGGISHAFEGICEGKILLHPKGDEGFGYDPLFQPSGFEQAFAEISSDEKNRISHRGRAVQEWTSFLRREQ